MERDELIAAEIFCTRYNVEPAFIDSLCEYGLIELTTIEEMQFIPADKLQQIERLTRLHYDLQINIEGIEAITYLLQKVERMQEEIKLLTNKLTIYEGR